MKTKRVIARLDVKNETLVKGVHLEGLRVLGKPELYAELYYNNGIDELFYMDVVASLYGRNSLVELVRKTAKKIFIPLTVGGGIRTADDIRALLNSGADKICINTAAVKEPSLVRKFSKIFGSSTIVVAIEAIKDEDGTYKVYIENGREYTGLDAVDWAIEVASLGAGEIVITSVDQEGTGNGMCLDLIQKISNAVQIPIVAHGGVGKIEHMIDAFNNTAIEGICSASLFHYDAVKEMDFDLTGTHGNLSFINSKTTRKSIQPVSIQVAKNALRENGINVR